MIPEYTEQSYNSTWKVGFHIRSLQMISAMSGLVEVYETYLMHDEEVVIFVVRNIDRTDSLFKQQGGLVAAKVNEYVPVDQSILVSSKVSFCGGEKCLKN